MMPTLASVIKAMYRYNNWGATKFYKKYSSGRVPVGHFLLHQGRKYPLKALWAAAHVPAIHTREFQTANAAAGFKALGIGQAIYSKVPMQDEASEDEIDSKDAIEHEAVQRRKRLASAAKFPSVLVREITDFVRNPDVVAEVLYRAQGWCETCCKPAPFLRASDGTPYLEVHHVIPLAQGGEDSVENAVGLCPNCHRRAHFG